MKRHVSRYGMTNHELEVQLTFARNEIKDLRIENERLRRIGLIGRIIKLFKKLDFLKDY